MSCYGKIIIQGILKKYFKLKKEKKGKRNKRSSAIVSIETSGLYIYNKQLTFIHQIGSLSSLFPPEFFRKKQIHNQCIL
jgi:hypothetical protein